MFRSFPTTHRAVALPAISVALACLLAGLQAPRAWAQGTPRTIAIVNLSTAEGAEAAAAQARSILSKAPGLRPTDSGDLARTLESQLPEGGPDAPILAAASEALLASDAAFAEFKSKLAASEINRARRLLFSIAPSESTSKLLADLSFRMALIHLRANNMGLAMGEFQLHHRLVPESKIDPVRFPPGVVKAFDQARTLAPNKTTATLAISATYDGAPIFLDGKPAGSAPLSLPVTAGAHIVAIAAPQYQSAAQTIDIDPGDTQEIRIDLQPRSKVTRALELRFLAKEEGFNAASLRAAAARVSRLVGSDAVLIIVGEKSEATLYIQELDRLTYQRKVDTSLSRMLALTLPVARPTLLDGSGQPTVPTPWYRNPIAIAAAATGVSLTIIGVLSLGSSDNTLPERLGKPVWEF